MVRLIHHRCLGEIDLAIVTHKHARPATESYLFFRGLAEYYKASGRVSGDVAARTAAILFIESYVLPFYMRAIFNTRTDRWSGVGIYPPDLIVIEDFIAKGPPDLGSAAFEKSIKIFKDLIDLNKGLWDNKISPTQISTDRVGILTNIKKLVVDISAITN
jgi:hypothetical protein